MPEDKVRKKVKKEFGIHDLLVVGGVDENGIFNSDTLKRVAKVQFLKLEYDIC